MQSEGIRKATASVTAIRALNADEEPDPHVWGASQPPGASPAFPHAISDWSRKGHLESRELGVSSASVSRALLSEERLGQLHSVSCAEQGLVWQMEMLSKTH